MNPAFSIPIRVYYEDTDTGGVVYHSNYLNLMERARTEWLRSFLALIVPKRLAAREVVRNRIRRLAREAFRLGQAWIGAQDCVVRLVKVPGEVPITLAEFEGLFRRGANG